MAAPAKFLFDTDFSAPDRRERAATPAEVAQKVAAAEARAHRDGFAAGQREAKAESDRRSALALVSDLLDLTLIETGRLELKLKSVDLGAMIRNNVESNQLLARRKNIRVDTEIAPGLPAVNADPSRVEQVLTNFISNAIKYSEPGTTVTVRASAAGGEVRSG